MLFTTSPAILPSHIRETRDIPAVSRPIDPDLSNYSIQAHDALISFRAKSAEATASVTFIRDWAERASTVPERVFTASVIQPIVPLVQVGNTCGPTSLAMVMNALGVRISQAQTAADTHCSPRIGTSPIDIRNAARIHGLNASVINEATIATVKQILDTDGVCIALKEQEGALHYVVVNGYRTPKTGEVELLVSDPNGYQFYEPASSFEKSWSKLSLKGIGLGIDRCIIAVSKGSVPAERFSGWGAFLSESHSLLNRLSCSLESITQLTVIGGLAFSLLRRGKKKQPGRFKTPSHVVPNN